MTNLVDHARYELELLGEDQDVIDWMCKVIETFCEYGHSGGSASVLIPRLNLLLNHKNILPLTTNPDEWEYHDEDVWGAPGGVWQNKRNSEAFSHDKGYTYYLISEKNRMYTSDIYVAPEKFDEDLEQAKSEEQMHLLYSTDDAQIWAQEFMKNFGHRLQDIDEGLMIGWFANAIETAKKHGGK